VPRIRTRTPHPHPASAPRHPMFDRHIFPDEPGLTSLHAQGSEAILRQRRPALHHLQLLSEKALARLDERRDLFLRILEEVRREYRFVVLGYVVMPEHFHLLMSEPQMGTPSTAMQSVKQRFAQRVVPRHRQRRPAGTRPLQKTQGAGHPSGIGVEAWVCSQFVVFWGRRQATAARS
jgi:REP element-mobilizing transposase RayT